MTDEQVQEMIDSVKDMDYVDTRKRNTNFWKKQHSNYARKESLRKYKKKLEILADSLRSVPLSILPLLINAEEPHLRGMAEWRLKNNV